jgi:hypothetical protein
MFVAYPQNHSGNVYRLFNVKTRQDIKLRGLIWLLNYCESLVSKNQENESRFSDSIGDDDSDTTINILMSK